VYVKNAGFVLIDIIVCRSEKLYFFTLRRFFIMTTVLVGVADIYLQQSQEYFQSGGRKQQ